MTGNDGVANPYHKNKITCGDGVATLNSTECQKDLGIYIDTEMNFQCHGDRAASKANGPLSIAIQYFGHIDMIMSKSWSIGLSRPYLEYKYFVWTHFLKKDIKTIENVQRIGTRMIPELRLRF